MKQIVIFIQGLIPAGVYLNRRLSLATSGEYLAYASTISIFIVDLTTYQISKIITKHTDYITSID